MFQILLDKYEDSFTRYKKGKKLTLEKILSMILEVCFVCSEDNFNLVRFQVYFDEDGFSYLLVCEDCKVCVYVSKYI